MSIVVNFNSSQYLVPTVAENDWGPAVSSLLADLGGNATTTSSNQTLTNKVIQLQVGTVGAPSLSFVGSTSTGLYNPTINQLGLATNGVQRLLVDQTGIVSIPNTNIDGGTIDGTIIGSITPSTAAFTTLTATTLTTTGTGQIGNTLSVVNASSGFIQLSAGDATHTGYVGFFNAASVRQGYFGFSTTAGTMALVLEGSTTSLALAGNQSISGGLSVGASFSVGGNTTISGYLSCNNLFTGVISATSSINSTNYIRGQGLYATASPDTGFFIGPGGGGRVMQFSANWFWLWNTTSGQLQWAANGSPFWVLDNGSGVAYNALGYVAGFGAYQNWSDAAIKTNIVNYPRGLAAVMALQPVAFDRVDNRTDPDPAKPYKRLPREIGFIAQDVQLVLPEAINTVPLNGVPLLTVSSDTILAAVVNSIQNIARRVALLEKPAV